jgi:hypothetical protein
MRRTRVAPKMARLRVVLSEIPRPVITVVSLRSFLDALHQAAKARTRTPGRPRKSYGNRP